MKLFFLKFRYQLSVKMWCVNCKSVGMRRCTEQNHAVHPFTKFFKQTMQSVEERIDRLSLTWDEIVASRCKIQMAYRQTANFLGSLQENLRQRSDRNNRIIKEIMKNNRHVQQIDSTEISMETDDQNLNTDTRKLLEMVSCINKWENETETTDLTAARSELEKLTAFERHLTKRQIDHQNQSTLDSREPNSLQLLQQLILSLNTGENTLRSNGQTLESSAQSNSFE